MFVFFKNKHSLTFFLVFLLLFINVSFSLYFESSEDYPINVRPTTIYNKVHSKPQNGTKSNENKNTKPISSNKSKRNILKENKMEDSETILNGRNIRSPLGTMRFGKRGLLYEIPASDEDINNWIVYKKRTVRPSPLGTMRFGK